MANELRNVDFSITGAVDHALTKARYTADEIAQYGPEAADAEKMRRKVLACRPPQFVADRYLDRELSGTAAAGGRK